MPAIRGVGALLDVTVTMYNDCSPTCTSVSDVTATEPSYKKTALREAAVFFGFLLFGLLLLPFAVYLVGETIFGNYGGAGFADLYGRLLSEVRGGNAVAWFLVLSPYLVLQTSRLTIRHFRRTANRDKRGRR